MISKITKLGLTSKILLGMLLGFFVGMVLFSVGDVAADAFSVKDFLVSSIFDAGGQIFVATLKMLVVPLVVVSLICGTAALGDPKKLGRVGLKTLSLYLLTTAIAISIAMGLALLIGPGKGVDISAPAAVISINEAPSLKEVIIGIVPDNPFKAMVDGNMLQVIFFSLLFGLSLALIKPTYSEKLLRTFNNTNEVIMRMIMILMEFAPIGVFCLVAKVFAEQGLQMFAELALYFGVVVLALLMHFFFSYPTLLFILSRLSPAPLLKKLKRPLLFAFSTSSSNATLPVTLETMEQDIGVDRSIASFTIPLGATINMDGTAIMQGVATVFIANAYQVDLMLSDYLMVILTATLASIGTAGVPGVGLIMLAMVLKQVGLPVEGIGIVMAVDRLLDMMRTCVNICGDAVITTIVAKSENYLDIKKYHS